MRVPLAAVLLCAVSARAAEPSPPDTWTLRVHLLSDDERIELRRKGPEDSVVCKTPCGAVVQFTSVDEFELGGRGLRDSKSFHLTPRDGEVKLRVFAESRAPRVTGVVLMFAGGAVAQGGALIACAAWIGGGLCYQGDCERLTRMRDVALAVTFGGLAALLAGIVFFNSPPTRFDARLPAGRARGRGKGWHTRAAFAPSGEVSETPTFTLRESPEFPREFGRFLA